MEEQQNKHDINNNSAKSPLLATTTQEVERCDDNAISPLTTNTAKGDDDNNNGESDENGNNHDFALARRYQALEQLTMIFGFPVSVSEQAIDAVGFSDVTASYNYILDQNLASDSGGPVLPIDDCPHLERHVCLDAVRLTQTIIGGSGAGGRQQPQDMVCSYTAGGGGCRTWSNKQNQPPLQKNDSSGKRGLQKEALDEDGSCPSKENWMCLECGVVRCSRYQNGHAVEHWEETKTCNVIMREEEEEGHCVAVSFSDLSVWCHVCSAYVKHETILNPLVSALEQLKFSSTSS